jgi:hypothetical protein
MNQKLANSKAKSPPKNAGEARMRRVAAALKANLSRRKATAPEKLAIAADEGLPHKH